MRKTEALTVTVPVELKKQVLALAEKDSRSLSSMVTVLIQQGLEKKQAAYSR